ncbi:MAG: hypothetical protein K6G07_07470 [Lachnospiraceae bacterium]|nr:hypothetical protein [Lachnospiraceae bacterium]
MKKQKLSKVHSICLLLSVLVWGLTFVTDTKQFTSDPLNMSSLPMDASMVGFMHVLSKIVLLFVITGLIFFLRYAWDHKPLLYSFLGFFGLYVLLLLFGYPGYYTSDDTIIYGYATRYLPVYWHCYLTSLYHMVGLSLFPASTGPILLNDLCLALCFSYIYFETYELTAVGKKKVLSFLPLLCGLFPTVLLSALMCFRPVLYAPFFLFFFAFLYFEHRNKRALTYAKLVALTFGCALLCLWRGEGLVLCVFMIPILLIVYPSGIAKRDAETDAVSKGAFKEKRNMLLLYLLAFIVLFTAVKIPQNIGEKKYYGKDYLIISLVRPISVIVHRDQMYDGAEEDLRNIDAVISLDYIRYESLSCSSYGRYNTDHNLGHFTETGADPAAQTAFVKSAIRLILHNPDLFVEERIHLFLVTNGIYAYPKDWSLGLKAVTTAEFTSYLLDRDYGYTLIEGNKRLPISGSENVALSLFRYGGEALIAVLLLLILGLGFTAAKKKWLCFWILLSLLAREGVIFLLSPAAFVQYSFPTMFVVLWMTVMLITERLCDGHHQGKNTSDRGE